MRRFVREARHPAIRRDRLDNEQLRLICALSLLKDSNAIDVGAHSGTVLSEILRLAPEGRHFAFEPIPALAERLQRDFPGVRVHAAAAAAADGTAQFTVVTGAPALSGLRNRTPHAPTETISVRLVRLDDVIPEEVPISLLKVDVEGGELAVLQGARSMLQRHRPVITFEHGLGGADLYGTSPEELHAYLAQLGYRIFDLDGTGPYEVKDFRRAFDLNERWNWVAR